MDQSEFDECVHVVAKGLSDEDKAVFLEKMTNMPAEGTVRVELPSGAVITAKRDGDIWMYPAPNTNVKRVRYDEIMNGLPTVYQDYALRRYAQVVCHRDHVQGFSLQLGDWWLWIKDGVGAGRVYTGQKS